jgi:5-(carboxyamino)imidazole ribonucleotide synthase
MLAHAAQSLGYRVHVYEPSGPSPAGAVADLETCAPYEDLASLEAFARSVDVATYEFENVPAEPLKAVDSAVELLPAASVLHTCQNRWREKAWLRSNGFPHARYTEALEGDIGAAVAEVGMPCVVKTADFGYDGKGQMKIANEADLARASAIFRGRRCVVEQWIDFDKELSVICARTASGETRAFPVSENIHTDHILDFSIVPARIADAVGSEALDLAARITERLGVVGLLAVEFFLKPDGRVVVNELAPRPHNSGHWSLDGGETSQFEQHVRAICGLPLGPSGARCPTVMVNILGDIWKARDGAERTPDWSIILAEPSAKLHLYGKPEPRPGRKMGHFTVQAPDIEEALSTARRLKAALAA